MIDREIVRKNRTLVLEVFKDLRKLGFVAKANYLCCSSCAGYAIAEEVGKMTEEEAAELKGCVYWHQQDEESIKNVGLLDLRYGQIDTHQHGKVGLETEAVGKILKLALEAKGLEVVWGGRPNTVITVDLGGKQLWMKRR